MAATSVKEKDIATTVRFNPHDYQVLSRMADDNGMGISQLIKSSMKTVILKGRPEFPSETTRYVHVPDGLKKIIDEGNKELAEGTIKELTHDNIKREFAKFKSEGLKAGSIHE